MESATNNLDISRESRLSIELRAGKEETATTKLHSSKNNSTATADPRSPSKMSSLLPSPMFDLPVRQTPYNPSLEIPSTDSGTMAKTIETQAAKQDDCLLLDYQNQLFILENLNRRTSRKTRKPR